MIRGLNHFTVIAKDRECTLDFYVQVLGLQHGPRPELSSPGAWLYAGDHPLVHAYFDRPHPPSDLHTMDHIAFSASGLAGMKARFEARGEPFSLRRQQGAGTWQLFCLDPNGIRIEIDFDADESPDANAEVRPRRVNR